MCDILKGLEGSPDAIIEVAGDPLAHEIARSLRLDGAGVGLDIRAVGEGLSFGCGMRVGPSAGVWRE